MCSVYEVVRRNPSDVELQIGPRYYYDDDDIWRAERIVHFARSYSYIVCVETAQWMNDICSC